MPTTTTTTDQPQAPPDRCTNCDPVGLAEISVRLGIKRATLDMIRLRGGDNGLPPERWSVGGRSAWDWQMDIVPWAHRTGRWPSRGPKMPRRRSSS